MIGRPSWINVPFFLAGLLKILYDLLLYQEFVSIRPVEERPGPNMRTNRRRPVRQAQRSEIFKMLPILEDAKMVSAEGRRDI